MKLTTLTSLFYLTTLAFAAPPSSSPNDISIRSPSPLDQYSALEKRKGGGGGKGGGSGSSGSSGSSGGKGGSSGRPISSYSFSSSSNAGGSTRDGSGTPKSYGNRYTGGAVVPYTAGKNSPTRGIAPYALPLVGVAAVFPGLWLYGSLWAYPYHIPYYWNDGQRNRTSNVTCVCQQYQVCGCDPTDNSTYVQHLVSNGTSAPVNTSLVRTVQYDNGSDITYVNGSLANGTTASGGTDPSNADEISGAVQLMMGLWGYSIMVGTVVTGVMIF